MGIDGILSALGLGAFAGDAYFIAQLALALVSSLLFLCSIVVCAMAFKAAGVAKRARGEAGDLAVEVRRLTAQVENATARRTGTRIPAVAAEEQGEAEFATDEASHAEEEQGGDYADAEAAPDRTLEEAKKAATIPSALLRRRVMKRRA